ncbi:hypothetical protein FGCSD_1572 [Streptococcus dysgalactiae]|nr:hypothetical protein FGCSD_1572 [Streptococcus dysgalactiae]
MARPYEEIEKIEILTEFISGVYGRQLNKVLKQGLDMDDKSTFDCLLLQHLREMEYIPRLPPRCFLLHLLKIRRNPCDTWVPKGFSALFFTSFKIHPKKTLNRSFLYHRYFRIVFTQLVLAGNNRKTLTVSDSIS